MLGAVLPRSSPSEDAREETESAVVMLQLMEAATQQVVPTRADSHNLVDQVQRATMAYDGGAGAYSYVGGGGAVVTMPQHGERPARLLCLAADQCQ